VAAEPRLLRESNKAPPYIFAFGHHRNLRTNEAPCGKFLSDELSVNAGVGAERFRVVPVLKVTVSIPMVDCSWEVDGLHSIEQIYSFKQLHLLKYALVEGICDTEIFGLTMDTEGGVSADGSASHRWLFAPRREHLGGIAHWQVSGYCRVSSRHE
jgi:hypothetical protein